MRISELRVHLIEVQLPEHRLRMTEIPGLFSRRFVHEHHYGPPVTRYLPFLRLVTDAGLEGQAFGTPLSRAAATAWAEQVIVGYGPSLVGQDPLLHEYLWQMLYDADRFWIKGPLETVDAALWDLRGKQAGLPVYRLAGGFRDRVPAYLNIGGRTPAEAAADARRARDLGFPACKDHFYFGARRNPAYFEAVREAVGDEMILLHDPVQQYTHAEAVQIGRVLERLGYHWMEEPLRDQDLLGLKKVADTLDIAILALEVLPGAHYGTAPYLALEAVDIVRNGAHKGGLTAMLKIAHLAEGFGLNAEPVSAGSCLGFLHAHYLGAVRNAEFFEIGAPFSGTNPGVLFEELAAQIGLLTPLQVVDGHLLLPEGPGLGMVLEWERLERQIRATLSTRDQL